MIFKKKNKESKPKKEKKVPVMKVDTHRKTVIALWLVLIASVSFGVYKNFTAIDMHTVHEKEVIEQRIIDTNKIENFVKAFVKSYYSWSNTQESIDARTAAINNYLTKSLQDLNVDTVRQDIPTSSTVTDVKIWDIEQAGTDDFTVVYSVDQTVTEGETSIGYTSAYMVVVHVDGDGNMVITQNPTISSTPTKSSYEPKAKPFTVGTIGLFARKARCMNCGYTMRSSKNRGKHYLQCSNRHVAKDACIGSFISVDKLEKAVIDELNKLSAEYLDKDELEQNVQFNSDLRGKKEALETEIVAYQKKIAEYTKGIRELYLDKVKGILSELDYLDLSKDFSTQKERLEKLVIDTQKQLDVIERKMQVGDNRRQLIEQYTNLEHLDREIVEKLIDYVLVGKKDPVTKEVPIEIHWNF